MATTTTQDPDIPDFTIDPADDLALGTMLKLSNDLRDAALTLGPDQVRFMVDLYYQLQRDRIRAKNQVKAGTTFCDDCTNGKIYADGTDLDMPVRLLRLEPSDTCSTCEGSGVTEEPNRLISWVSRVARAQERGILTGLDAYSNNQELGRWCRSLYGVGPVISAGLMAHIDITKAPTVGHIWRFAGLDPTSKWVTKTKRPWNAKLKTLCWKAGDRFVKQQNHPKDVYGKVYAQRKAYEAPKNEAGEYADQAEVALRDKKLDKEKVAYAWYVQGKLPPGRLHLRALRYAVKLFLSHYHYVAYELHYGEPPPKPYILTRDNAHTHFEKPPNWPME